MLCTTVRGYVPVFVGFVVGCWGYLACVIAFLQRPNAVAGGQRRPPPNWGRTWTRY